MIYVVLGSWHDYGDDDTWPVKAFTSREQADEYAKECAREAVGVREKYGEIYKEFDKERTKRQKRKLYPYMGEDWPDVLREYNHNIRACIGVLDTHFYAGHSDYTEYSVEEIELV